MSDASSFPFPFFGHTFPEPGTEGHWWALRFEEAPPRAQRPDIARVLVEALTRGIFLQREDAPWRWSKDWMIVTADELPNAPDLASEARVDALTSVENALKAVHALAPLAEVLFDAYSTPSGSPWDAWSRGAGRKPSVRGTAIFRKGAADAAVEAVRLADPGVQASAASELAITEIDKKLVPSAKLLPPAAARLAGLEAQQQRGDRVYGVSDTQTGQAVWLMTSVGQPGARDELGIATASTYVAMPVHSPSRQDHDRARADGDAEGWLLVTDVRRESVREVQPSTGTSRLVCDVPCGTTGPTEAVRVEQGIVVSTTHGLFLVARSEAHAPVPVAFLPRRGFRHIAPVPSRRGVVSCEFGGEGSVAVVSADMPLEVVREITAQPALTEPALHGGRVLAKQGRSWRQIVGIDVPVRAGAARERLAAEAEARLARGEPALVPTDDAVLPPLRFHGGRRVVAACRARGAEVLILDDPEQRAIVVVRDDGSEHAVAVERGSQPSTLEPSPDGRRVLVAGRRFLHAELHVDDAALRPIGDPMRRMAPNRGIDVACYIGDDRLLFPSSGQLRVHDTKGAILANVPTELHEWPNLAVASAQGDVLFRNGAGEAILVRTRGGEIVSHARIGTHVAHVFVHDEQLFATCHGLACRLHAQALV
ncbi:MAG: hypothetical protein U0234_08500 [Sandaracinus sp.]